MSQGIFGIVDYNKPIDNSDRLAVAMGKFLQKDGSREEKISYECDNYYILGMKRICEAPYQQTAIAQNDAVQSLCLIHGEIHNFQEVLKEHLDVGAHCEGDLDLALQLYNRYGPQFAQKLNGLFSLAILDQKDQSLTLLNDRVGMAHQVYWTAISSRLYFATHLKTEEDLMKRVNFPGYLEHKEAHETILLEFGDLKRSLMEEGIGIHTAIHVNRLMTKWFITHISKLDQEYGRFIKKQNITS